MIKIAMHRHAQTDEQWRCLQALLPKQWIPSASALETTADEGPRKIMERGHGVSNDPGFSPSSSGCGIGGTGSESALTMVALATLLAWRSRQRG